jgi:hypothetical protein
MFSIVPSLGNWRQGERRAGCIPRGILSISSWQDSLGPLRNSLWTHTAQRAGDMLCDHEAIPRHIKLLHLPSYSCKWGLRYRSRARWEIIHFKEVVFCQMKNKNIKQLLGRWKQDASSSSWHRWSVARGTYAVTHAFTLCIWPVWGTERISLGSEWRHRTRVLTWPTEDRWRWS